MVKTTRFWLDLWVLDHDLFKDRVTSYILGESNFYVVSHVIGGDYNWNKLDSLLHSDVCASFDNIKPPPASVDDVPSWSWTGNTDFSIKLTYTYLSTESHDPNTLPCYW
jgi:hypothetical protein